MSQNRLVEVVRNTLVVVEECQIGERHTATKTVAEVASSVAWLRPVALIAVVDHKERRRRRFHQDIAQQLAGLDWNSYRNVLDL